MKQLPCKKTQKYLRSYSRLERILQRIFLLNCDLALAEPLGNCVLRIGSQHDRATLQTFVAPVSFFATWLTVIGLQRCVTVRLKFSNRTVGNGRRNYWASESVKRRGAVKEIWYWVIFNLLTLFKVIPDVLGISISSFRHYLLHYHWCQTSGMLDQPCDIVLVGGKGLIVMLTVMFTVKTFQLHNCAVSFLDNWIYPDHTKAQTYLKAV